MNFSESISGKCVRDYYPAKWAQSVRSLMQSVIAEWASIQILSTDRRTYMHDDFFKRADRLRFYISRYSIYNGCEKDREGSGPFLSLGLGLRVYLCIASVLIC